MGSKSKMALTIAGLHCGVADGASNLYASVIRLRSVQLILWMILQMLLL